VDDAAPAVARQAPARRNVPTPGPAGDRRVRTARIVSPARVPLTLIAGGALVLASGESL